MSQNHVDVFLKTLAREGGSDLHLSPTIAPRIRIDGTLQTMATDPLTDEQIRLMLDQIMPPDAKQHFESLKNADFAYDAGEIGRFRVNALVQKYGAGAVFRIIPTRIPTCEDLELPPPIRKMAEYPTGLVLVTGPTGSGKSTTLAALVNEVNRNRGGHILTIEDPVEFTHPSKNCIVTHRELGQSFPSFPAALRAALREDPDVIVVGEMRDPETIKAALTLAETGHLVFGTLHTFSAMKAVDRIVDEMDTDRQQQIRNQLAEVLRGVVAQKLLPRSSGKGRIAAFEILIPDDGIRNLLKKGQTSQIESSMNDAESGMQTMQQALAQLVVSGWITPATGRSNANDIDKYEDALKRYSRGY